MASSYRRSALGGISGAIIMLGIFLPIAFGGFNLPVFFVALGIAIFVGSLASGSPRSVYSSMYGSLWMIVLALFFFTGNWLWFVIGGVVCCVLGSLTRPILASMGYVSTCATVPMARRQPQPYYQPSEQSTRPAEASYQPYEQGYQQEQPETYQEGARPYPYPPTGQYEEPQAQYPQQMPPQQ